MRPLSRFNSRKSLFVHDIEFWIVSPKLLSQGAVFFVIKVVVAQFCLRARSTQGE